VLSCRGAFQIVAAFLIALTLLFPLRAAEREKRCDNLECTLRIHPKRNNIYIASTLNKGYVNWETSEVKPVCRQAVMKISRLTFLEKLIVIGYSFCQRGFIQSSGLRYLGFSPTTTLTTKSILPTPSSSSDSAALPIVCPSFTSSPLFTAEEERL